MRAFQAEIYLASDARTFSARAARAKGDVIRKRNELAAEIIHAVLDELTRLRAENKELREKLKAKVKS